MVQPKFKHIYGPVYSWRMGMSLGIDPVSSVNKVCNLNCTYCQLGCSGPVADAAERRVYVSTQEIVEELKTLDEDVRVDHMTFSGNGEPTLAANIGDMIRGVARLRRSKVAVITNGTLLGRKDVQADLAVADLVVVKLEAADEEMFQAMNRPAAGITYAGVLEGIRDFRRGFKGRMALQVMFVEKNKDQGEAIARLTAGLAADEVQLNTPLRPCAEKPLTPYQMVVLKKYFSGQHVRSVYEEEKKAYLPFDDEATMRRHGQFKG